MTVSIDPACGDVPTGWDRSRGVGSTPGRVGSTPTHGDVPTWWGQSRGVGSTPGRVGVNPTRGSIPQSGVNPEDGVYSRPARGQLQRRVNPTPRSQPHRLGPTPGRTGQLRVPALVKLHSNTCVTPTVTLDLTLSHAPQTVAPYYYGTQTGLKR